MFLIFVVTIVIVNYLEVTSQFGKMSQYMNEN